MQLRDIETATAAWMRDCEDPRTYPLVQGVSTDARTVYLQVHAFLHLASSMGRLGKLMEPLGHGADLHADQRASLLEAVAKMIIDAFAVGRFIGLSAEEIDQAVFALVAKRAT